VVHAGNDSFPLGDGIRAVVAKRLLVDFDPLSASRGGGAPA
jgi:hypothetical protein